MIVVPWLWRYKIKPSYAKAGLNHLLQKHPDKQRLEMIIRFLSLLYRGIHSNVVSSRERKRLSLTDDTFIYGEIEFLPFIFILEKAQPQPGEVFYDLGSGGGKAVFAAALSYPFSKACGIELLPGLHKLAKLQINKALTHAKISKQLSATYLPRLACIQLINADFLKTDITDGDIVFINATCIHYHTWEALTEILAQLKPGSRVIITTKKIQHEKFELLYQGREVMSWGMNLVSIYLKMK